MVSSIYSELFQYLIALSELRKKELMDMDRESQAQFEKLKTAFTTASVLSNTDFSYPIYIQYDDTTTGIGSVLFYWSEEGKEHLIKRTQFS